MSTLSLDDATRHRAEAAERTVDVLKRKVVELYNGEGPSLQRQLESARRREEASRSLISLCLTGRAQQEYVLGVDQVFEDILPTEVSLAQLRRKFPMSHGSVLDVEGSALRRPTGDVRALLLTISDITALEAATKENHNNRTLVSILRQKDSFQNFLLEAKRQLAHGKHVLTEPGRPEASRTAIRHIVHTLTFR